MADEKGASEQQSEVVNDEDKPLTRKDLLDYVVKLNDREIGKTKNTGFTILALLTAIGAIGYKIFDLFPIYQCELESLLVILTFLTNLALVGYRLWLDLSSEYNKTYLSNGIKSYNFSIYAVMWGVIVVSAIILNAKSKELCFIISNYEFTLNQWFINAYSLVLFFNPIQYTIKEIKSRYKKVDYEIIDLRIDSYDFWIVNQMKGFVPIILLIILIHYFDYVHYIFYFDIYNNFHLVNLKIIKLSCMIFAIFILIVISIKQATISLSNKYSENIEKNIIASNLSTNKIRQNIVKHFGCQTLNEWIQEQHEFQQEYVRDMENHKMEFPGLLCVLKNDIQQGNLKSNQIYHYISNEKIVLNKYRKIYDTKMKELKLMWVETTLFSYEAKKIDEIIKQWDKSYTAYIEREKWFEEKVEEIMINTK